MNEQDVIKIVQNEIAKAAQKAQYGVTRVPVHTHNNIDSPNLPPHNIAGFQALPGANGGGGVLALASNQTVSGPPADNDILNPPQIMVFPIPVIYGPGAFTSFNEGTAPNGTVLMFDTGGTSTSFLYVHTLNGWYGFSPSVAPARNIDNFFAIEGNTNGTNSVTVSPVGGFTLDVLITGVYLISKDTTAGTITVANNGSTVATIAKGTVSGVMTGATSLANTTVTAGNNITVVSSSAGNASVFITYQGT